MARLRLHSSLSLSTACHQLNTTSSKRRHTLTFYRVRQIPKRLCNLVIIFLSFVLINYLIPHFPALVACPPSHQTSIKRERRSAYQIIQLAGVSTAVRMSYRVGMLAITCTFNNDVVIKTGPWLRACDVFILLSLLTHSFPETASTSRAGCRAGKCKEAGTKIMKGELRFGTWVVIQEHGGWQWRHW